MLGYSCILKKEYSKFILLILFFASNENLFSKPHSGQNPTQEAPSEFEYFAEQFSDLKILRYQVPGFKGLSPQQKEFAYYLSEAALSGREIIWDQNYKYNLTIKKTLEEIIKNYRGDRENEEFIKFEVYLKKIWFSNGIHHHYSMDKFTPEFSREYFKTLIKNTYTLAMPMHCDETQDEFITRISNLIFDPTIAPKKVSLDSSKDMVQNSAVNFYENLSQEEVENFYKIQIDADDPTPISYGLNSKLKKLNGSIVEQKYKIGGMYSNAIEQIVYWLKKATTVAQSELQKDSLEMLIAYYETGDLRKFDEYNLLWVRDTHPEIDTINGFIEVYNDPLGYTGSWEALVEIKDLDASAKFGVLSSEAGWFEAHSPIDPAHKKEEVTGVTYNIINVVMEAGDSSPSTPIGINLPNSNWIRELGSKSVSIGNIETAYSEASKSNGSLEEFYLPEQQKWIKKYGHLADRLSTGLHEVVGHASGKLLPGVGTPKETLKSYSSTLEEARADLVSLYYIGDQHLVDIGLVPSTDIIKAEYIQYINNGLFKQLSRIKEGNIIEEAHMRNRQMISLWAYEHGKSENVIERVIVDGKTHFVINDYEKLRTLFGQLLREVQRVKSEGDYEAGKYLVETYGVQVDQELHKEILLRWGKLNVAPYGGFINPRIHAIKNSEGKITDVTLNYDQTFTEQMLYYSEHYSFLDAMN